MSSSIVRLAPIPVVERSPTVSKALEHGLRILELFTGGEPEWRMVEVADQVEMPRPTVHRYLKSLVALGQLERAGVKYRIVGG